MTRLVTTTAHLPRVCLFIYLFFMSPSLTGFFFLFSYFLIFLFSYFLIVY